MLHLSALEWSSAARLLRFFELCELLGVAGTAGTAVLLVLAVADATPVVAPVIPIGAALLEAAAIAALLYASVEIAAALL